MNSSESIIVLTATPDKSIESRTFFFLAEQSHVGNFTDNYALTFLMCSGSSGARVETETPRISEPKSSCHFLAQQGVPVDYGYRSYGVILYIVGIVFTDRVYRISQNEKP